MSKHCLFSPDGRVCLTLTLEQGSAYYKVSRDTVTASSLAPLGLVTSFCDLTQGLRLVREERGEIREDYRIPAFKKTICQNRANTICLTLEKEGNLLQIEGRAYDDGAAVRLTAGGEGKARILSEETGFSIPDSAGEIYAQKLLFSYEDNYQPVPREELAQNRWAFPLLLHLQKEQWALYTEAAVTGEYGGSNLLSGKERPALLKIQKAPDMLEDITGTLPVHTPWRVVMAGDLNTIVSSNLLENLCPPSIVEEDSFIRPGRSGWSWMTENDSCSKPQRMREYVDYSAEMGFEYFLVDGGWPGNVDIPALVEYAKSKNVAIWLWEHSAQMADPALAEEKMKLWSGWGIAGIKIDFFESDSQERVGRMEMLARLGAKYRLMLNFHGCTKPSGMSRTWPHVMTYEGVMGGEYLQCFSGFLPGGPDAAHNCTLPFTRNAVGPMDYTPIIYRSYTTGTTDTHQTALSVVFSSYILHIGEGKDAVLENPCRPFLERVPASWDETRLLEGYPASHVTMARRKGRNWFIGGICARRPRNAQLDFSFLPEGEYEGELYCDDLSENFVFDVAEGALPPATPDIVNFMKSRACRPALHAHDMHAVQVERFTVCSGERKEIPLAANGGFVLRLIPAAEKE